MVSKRMNREHCHEKDRNNDLRTVEMAV